MDLVYIRSLGNFNELIPEDGDIIESPKRCVLNKNRTVFYIKTRRQMMFRNIIFVSRFYRVLTMAYNTQNYWFSHFVHRPDSNYLEVKE
jgi:hypothetical protein